MSLAQSRTFDEPVHKSDGGSPPAGLAALIAVGDTVHVIQRDRTLATVTVTAVSNGAKTIEWDITTGQPRSDDIIGVDGQHQYVVDDSDPLHTDETQFGDLPPVNQTE
jgi:hypothetical protein